MPTFSKIGSPFDGFCDKPLYQMVPLRDMRRLQFYNDGPDCELYIDDPSVAGLANFIDSMGRSLPTNSPITDSFPVPRNGTVSFTVNGKAVGSTMLLFHTDAHPGDPNKGVQLSVKGRQSKSVSLLSLADNAGHKGSLAVIQVKEIFARVQKMYLDQCNVDLKVATPQKVVNIAKGLANPLVYDKAKGGVGDILDVLLAVSHDASEVKSSDIVILFLWDITSQSDVGVDTLAVCMPWDLWKPGLHLILFDDSQDAYVLGHEVGHALGLGHNLRAGSLMNAFQPTQKSSRLEQYEIDLINDDGT